MKLSKDEIAARVDVAKSETEGLARVGIRLTKRVVRALFKAGMSAEDLLERIRHASHPDVALETAINCYGKSSADRYKCFVKAVVELDEEWYEQTEISNGVVLRFMVQYSPMIMCLVDEHRVAVTTRDSEFYWWHEVGADVYWSRKVRHYFVKGDFRRAHDELRKGRLGFVRADFDRTIKQPFGAQNFPENRCWWMSRQIFVALMWELFHAMQARGLLTEEESDFEGACTRMADYFAREKAVRRNLKQKAKLDAYERDLDT